MSFSKEKRSAIKHYMLEKISEGSSDIINKTVATFTITPNTAYRYMRELNNSGVIFKRNKRYHLSVYTKVFKIKLAGVLPEDDDVFFSNHIFPMISSLPDNIIHMWSYCFTEMMNNVIDHSCASDATVILLQDAINTTILIADNGVGIFRKIKEFYNYPSLDDAILELFKGKLTTDSKNHSGEGIFFSSRIMDSFIAISDGKFFSHTEYDELIDDLESDNISIFPYESGTTIIMRLSNTSNKTNKEIMDTYSDTDGGFIRTRIPIKNIYPTYPVSRSQAKRLSHRFESFKEVELDFKGVSEIGQGFAHELFVVYAKKHPEIALIPFNANLDVQKMIHHVVTS